MNTEVRGMGQSGENGIYLYSIEIQLLLLNRYRSDVMNRTMGCDRWFKGCGWGSVWQG